MYEKYLPIGTVVLLKGATKRLMITGFCSVSNDDKNTIYDYSGCLYPEGVLSTDRNLLFNHSDIQRIYGIGYSDDEDKTFRKQIKEEMESKQK